MPLSNPNIAPIEKEIASLRRAVEAMAEQVRLSRIPITRLLTLEEAAEALGSSTSTVRRLIERGTLPVVKLPSARGQRTVSRVQASDLQEFINKQRTVPQRNQEQSGSPLLTKKRRTILVPTVSL